MRLLLDENLSPRLIPRLLELYGEIAHVRDVGLRQADDRSIWTWAKTNEYAVITTDSDFVAMSQRFGFPPRVIHIEQCDFPFRVIEDLLRRSAVRITEFEKDHTTGVLALRVPPSVDLRVGDQVR